MRTPCSEKSYLFSRADLCIFNFFNISTFSVLYPIWVPKGPLCAALMDQPPSYASIFWLFQFYFQNFILFFFEILLNLFQYLYFFVIFSYFGTRVVSFCPIWSQCGPILSHLGRARFPLDPPRLCRAREARFMDKKV